MTQKELKAIYTEELKKAWESERMVKYCAGEVGYIVEHNGRLYGIDKPRIETSFCFGYGYCGITDPDEERNAEKLAHKAQTSKDYFIDENLRDINNRIKILKSIREDTSLKWCEGSHPVYMLVTGEKYNGQTDDCRLSYFSTLNAFDFPEENLCWDVELIDKIIAGYEQVKADFIKRLNTYLKRYGLTKVNSWTYLSD